MSHGASTDYVRGVLSRLPEARVGARVLEFGSYNVNGTIREVFENPAAWVGVDWRPGPCVDVVSLFHDFDRVNLGYTEPFDVFVSVNSLEHDPYWQKSLEAGVRALRPGGYVIITVPTGNFGPHEIDCSPKTGYYCNLRQDEFLAVLQAAGVTGHLINTQHSSNPELYFEGRRVL